MTRGDSVGIGFVAIDLLAASLFRSSELDLPAGGVAALLDENGRYLLHYPDPEEWVGKMADEKAKALLTTIPLGSNEVILSHEQEGRKVFTVVERIDAPGGSPFYLSITLDQGAFAKPLFQQLFGQLAVVGGVTLGALWAAWWMGNLYIVRPTQHLMQVTQRIRTGDLTGRSALGPEMGEFREIGIAFDATADALSQRIAELNRTQEELREARDKLEVRVEQRTEELRRTQERLVDAIESLDAGFAMFDANQRLIIFNQEYKRMYGAWAGDIMKPGVSYEALCRLFVEKRVEINGMPADEPWLAERLSNFAAADGKLAVQRQGDRWLRVSINRTRDGGAVALRTDVTSLKEVQELLKLRDRAIASLNSGVIVTAMLQGEERFVDVNPAFERITGYQKGEVLGKSPHILEGEETDPASIKAINQAMLQGRELQSILRNYRKDGTPFWCELKLAPVYDTTGELRYCVGILTDVTQREEASAEAQRIAEELRRSNEELEQFAYIASHDLQEPLRMVSSYTELLARRYHDKLDQDGKDFIAYAADGARRMQAFIQDLLRYSRVGTQGGRFQPVDLNALLPEVLDNFRYAVAERHAEIKVGPLPEVLGDPVQLSQIFQNMIGNAIKFHAAERPLRVEITATAEEGIGTFSIKDNGIGFDEADSEKIFTIFARLHSGEGYEGTGIGLAICKRIVERHGGAIWVTSQPGVGSTFSFTLPLAMESGKKTGENGEPPANI